METDRLPRAVRKKAEYSLSDSTRFNSVPPPEPLRGQVAELKLALKSENLKEVAKCSNAIAKTIAAHYEVEAPTIKVLNSRPLKITKEEVTELYGDYDFETLVIRLWMRTAVKKETTSFGTYLSTLIHEICHHLDVQVLNMPETYHTRGFYERIASLYHHAQGTPVRQIVWKEGTYGTYRVDWPATMKAQPQIPAKDPAKDPAVV